MNPSASIPAPATSSVLFARGVIARLAIWPTLRVAIQENWGGPHGLQKRTWVASEIVDAFEREAETPDDQYVEEMLLQILEDEFEASLEDGSGEIVAKDIVKIWEETRLRQQILVLKFEEMAEQIKDKKVQATIDQGTAEEWSESDEDGSSDDEHTDADNAPQLVDRRIPKERQGPAVDDDGFTLVKGKSKANR